MEEILASIKRVIAEETPPSAPPRARQPVLQADDDVLELSNPVPEVDPLVSDGVTGAARSSLAALADARRAESPFPHGDGPLEAVVRDMLKPLLKQWLDEKLPGIVEELVKQEIARITGKSI